MKARRMRPASRNPADSAICSRRHWFRPLLSLSPVSGAPRLWPASFPCPTTSAEPHPHCLTVLLVVGIETADAVLEARLHRPLNRPLGIAFVEPPDGPPIGVLVVRA